MHDETLYVTLLDSPNTVNVPDDDLNLLPHLFFIDVHLHDLEGESENKLFTSFVMFYQIFILSDNCPPPL